MKRTQLAVLAVLIAVLSLGVLPVQAQGDGKLTKTTLAYAQREGVDPDRLSLDIYTPNGAQNWPVMVMIHGGGWQIGDKSNANISATKPAFFAAEGYVYVAINYRLSPTVQHPAHVEDVAAALAFLHDNIAKYGGNPDRLFVMGHSAGAHLAALVATDARRLMAYNKPLTILRGVVLLDGGGYDIPEIINLRGALRNNASVKIYTTAFTTDEKVWIDASPMTHVAAGKGIPPFLIIHVARSIGTRQQAQRLGEALAAAGVPAKVYEARGKTHSTLNRDIGRRNDAPTAEIMAFLKGLK
jgi:acetyl esterase/lipase